MKKIAITIQNFVQFYSVQPFIDNYNEAEIHLFVPEAINDMGFKEMFDDIYNYLVVNKYKVYRSPKKNIKYQILLEPYPMDIYFKFNYKYRIKYKYFSVAAKPKLTYNISECILYDGILCHSTYEKEVLSSFTKTFLVGRLYFNDFKKKNSSSKKKTILYLPTYGDFNYIDEVVCELEKLSDKYNIITKEHHGTSYLHSENEKSKKLKKVIDKFYDSSYSLSKLFEISDVVLSDNSGAIFEALYCRVPVCIYSKDINCFNLNNLESLQSQLVQKDIIPYTNVASGIENIVNISLTNEYIKKQNDVSDNLFPIKQEDILKSFIKVIDYFLNEENDDLNKSIILHREVLNYINSVIDKNNSLINENKKLNDLLNNSIIDNERLNNIIEEYRNGKLYKLSSKIYSIKSKILRKNK